MTACPRVFTADDFIVIGRALYGLEWQVTIARDLDVALRVVQRWVNGARPIPPGIWAELAVICEKHGQTLIGLARKIGENQ